MYKCYKLKDMQNVGLYPSNSIACFFYNLFLQSSVNYQSQLPEVSCSCDELYNAYYHKCSAHIQYKAVSGHMKQINQCDDFTKTHKITNV